MNDRTLDGIQMDTTKYPGRYNDTGYAEACVTKRKDFDLSREERRMRTEFE